MDKLQEMHDYTYIFHRLQNVFRSTFEDDTIEIFDEMTADDIDEWDSITHITLIISVEQEFSLRLNAAEIGELENVGDMIQLLQQKAVT